MIRLREQEFAEIVKYMGDEYGINLGKKKVLIECRMTKLLEKRGLSSFEEYLELMRKDKTGDLAGEMVNSLTTNYTYFYREPDHFISLQKVILPELLERRQYSGLDIWCAGCSTGEECYTLAMALEECRRTDRKLGNTRIWATDISAAVLEKAQKGEYPEKEMEGLPADWQKKYCRRIDDRSFRVAGELKKYIRFQKRNLLEPPAPSEKFDLILCRNVMIYFDKDVRQKLIRILESSLHPGGYLLTGHAELLASAETILKPVFPAVYRKEMRKDK